jgi:DNA-binding beta-propeller fold protein YncE
VRRANVDRASLLAAILALSACQGRGGEPIAPASAASSRQAMGQPVRTFRLTPRGGIGFDDLWFSSEMRSVLAPAGGTGCVELFDAGSFAQTSLCGVGPGGSYAGGHGEGTTSADFGAGFVFAIDRGSQSLKMVDPKLKRVVASAPLAGGPDYVRWVSSTREVWVTEPDQEQIELFSLTSDSPPQVVRAGTIAVRGGPESLVIDAQHDRAFTHLWHGRTMPITIRTHATGPSFANGCEGSRGIALDPERGQLYVGCAEGKAVVVDVERGNRIVSSAETSDGVDIIAVSSSLHHLYVPAASDGRVAVLGVAKQGKLSKLGSFQATKGAHCAISDDHDRVWVCSPDNGSLLVFNDRFPRAEE